ncbi:hypothetical protein Oscil6304_4218 [Oscillatoria acuminata PCC 6304]|uniref:Uncharacterized protein n=1 Tax=Oscillatoria acuminata PCC 6304 TaxID=56110 RepID=K9TNM6_9CYAN|nr:hypothetical protein Oscil6304_4218 [Oscillatoria acuminata PCC 6304]
MISNQTPCGVKSDLRINSIPQGVDVEVLYITKLFIGPLNRLKTTGLGLICCHGLSLVTIAAFHSQTRNTQQD